MGPVQVLVIGLERPSSTVDGMAFTGEVAAELAVLREAGVVRLIDVVVVIRHDDETFETLDVVDFDTSGDLVAELLGRDDDDAGTDGDHLWSLADAVPVGSTAAVALIEHVWAGPLRDAIGRAGGVTLDETWLTADDAGRLEALMAARRN
jgi:hypothetical protein